MSASGRAIELLRDWREGYKQEHQHAWGVECLACTAESSPWEVLTDAARIMGWLPPLDCDCREYAEHGHCGCANDRSVTPVTGGSSVESPAPTSGNTPSPTSEETKK